MSITPRALAELLSGAGYPVTERRLTDWRTKRWIPDVCRGERPRGTGRGAHYEWQDGEIIAQVFTLLNMLELRGRMETASVLAWFCGFDVPRDMRGLWVSFERLPWEKALSWALAGEDGSVKDAVDMLVLDEQLKQRKKTDGYSDGFVDALGRMGVDPTFDARTYLPTERIEKILGGDDVPRLAKHGAEIASMLSADNVRRAAILVQDYWSTPRRITVIQGIPDEMLAKAHADVRFLLTPYRKWVESSLVAIPHGVISDSEMGLLWIGSRLAWQAGRLLMQLDIALRRLGYGNEVDATISMLRDLAADDDMREVARAFRRDWQLMGRAYPGSTEATGAAADAVADELLRDPVYDKAGPLLRPVANALGQLWMPRLQLAFAAAVEGVEDEAASTARYRSPAP
jgi:hypothetical protein